MWNLTNGRTQGSTDGLLTGHSALGRKGQQDRSFKTVVLRRASIALSNCLCYHDFEQLHILS